MDQTMDLDGEAWYFRQRVAWITEQSIKYSPYAAEPIQTSRSLCICFCRQTESKDCDKELRRDEIRRTTAGDQKATRAVDP